MGLQDEIRKAVKWDTPHVNANDSLRKAIQQMVRSKVSALVVKMDEVVVGIVSDVDLARCLVGNKDLDATKVVELMSACGLITGKGVAHPCAQLHEMESVMNALSVIDAAGTHNLLVSGDDDSRVGIVSIRDLLEVAIS